jgi:hypothetical protein
MYEGSHLQVFHGETQAVRGGYHVERVAPEGARVRQQVVPQPRRHRRRQLVSLRRLDVHGEPQRLPRQLRGGRRGLQQQPAVDAACRAGCDHADWVRTRVFDSSQLTERLLPVGMSLIRRVRVSVGGAGEELGQKDESLR